MNEFKEKMMAAKKFFFYYFNLFFRFQSFGYQFLKSLRVLEAAVVIERSSEVIEPTIVLDEDETITDFVTICSIAESNVPSTM